MQVKVYLSLSTPFVQIYSRTCLGWFDALFDPTMLKDPPITPHPIVIYLLLSLIHFSTPSSVVLFLLLCTFFIPYFAVFSDYCSLLSRRTIYFTVNLYFLIIRPFSRSNYTPSPKGGGLGGFCCNVYYSLYIGVNILHLLRLFNLSSRQDTIGGRNHFFESSAKITQAAVFQSSWLSVQWLPVVYDQLIFMS